MRWDTRDKTAAVALLNADGTGERLLTSPGQVEMQGSDWSKDGRAILGACRFNESDRYSTCLVSVSSANPAGDSMVQVIASDPARNLFNQRFSPDQRWITFLAHDLSHAATSTVYVEPAAGGPWRAITDGAWFDDKPRWGPDGHVLYFVSNRTRRRERLGTTIRRRDRHAGRRPVPGHVVPIGAVPADAADRADGHRRSRPRICCCR